MYLYKYTILCTYTSIATIKSKQTRILKKIQIKKNWVATLLQKVRKQGLIFWHKIF